MPSQILMQAALIFPSWIIPQDVSPPSSGSRSVKYFDVREIQFRVHFCEATINCPVPGRL